MLSTFRDRHTKRILWILVITVVPAFVIWGGIKGRSKDTVGTLNGRTISASEFNSWLLAARLFILRNLGDTYRPTQKELTDLAFDLLMLDVQARQEQIQVNDKQVAQDIATRFFRQRKYSKQSYEQMLSSQQLSSRMFEDTIRKLIAIETVLEKHSAVTVTEEELRQAYTNENQKAKIAYLFIPYEKFKVNMTVKDEELEAFYQQNTNRFRREPKVALRYILLPQGTDPSQLDTATPATLEALAQALALDIKETGFIGIDDPIKDIGFNPQVTALAFSLQKGTLSQPIATTSGTVIFEKTDEQAAFTPAFAEIKAEVEAHMTADNAKEDARRYAREILDTIKEQGATDLRTVTDGTTAEFKETGFFKRNDYIEGVGLEQAVTSVVFSLRENEIHREPIELTPGIYIVQLKELTPFDEKNFTEQRATYEQRLRQEKEIAEKVTFLNELRATSKLAIDPRFER